MSKLLDSRATAKKLEVSPRTLRRWVKKGIVKPVIGADGTGRWHKFDAAQIEEHKQAKGD